MISANSNRKYVERLVSKVDWNHFISQTLLGSPDSILLEYVADKDYRKQFVVVDGIRGKETDRLKRSNTYVKDFKSLKTGVKHLEKGTGELTLKATDIPGSMVMDMRLLMLTRME